MANHKKKEACTRYTKQQQKKDKNGDFYEQKQKNVKNLGYLLSGLDLNVDAIEDSNEQVDYEDIGAEQVHRHHNWGYPPAPQPAQSKLQKISITGHKNYSHRTQKHFQNVLSCQTS